MKHLEIQYGQNTLLAGDVSLTNESFDHAFGVEKRVGYEVTDFRVLEYCKEIKDWVDTTSAHKRNERHFNHLKDRFLDKAQAQLEMESA